MDNDLSSLNAISHKALKSLLKKAKKEFPSVSISKNENINENQDFNNLITDWTEASQKILLVLNKGEKGLNKDRNPKTLMALGAMGAHINMALQALKATEFDQ
ncbi:MATH domain-containing protein [Prochlorococcus marinus]|uniref:MATH domain-containing protein n=1 Tax=Prochlorococcus marinus XMU1408 TaxID=2213228 RepID=A0A318R7G3_PROMR|nr:MATH domain-containing protein [Prochlorococcus marinus]MBW3042543.1 MATH domain-containing protein [Prochlorococcus marinus str. XMU1408]PYE01268.1 MATH domain-containing protein [Prochlorococcus marinus XMU1408]